MESQEELSEAERGKLLALGYLPKEIWVPESDYVEAKNKAIVLARQIIEHGHGKRDLAITGINVEQHKLSNALQSDQLLAGAANAKRRPAVSVVRAIIGAVFSIQANNTAWINVTDRFEAYAKAKKGSVADFTLNDFARFFGEMKNEMVFNKQQIGGRLKSDICLDISQALGNADLAVIGRMSLSEIEKMACKLEKIHGVGPALIQFFLLLCGRDDFIKGDTMLISYVSRALGRQVKAADTVRLLTKVAEDHSVSPGNLDLVVWRYEREHRKQSRKNKK
ncbi:MAG TPA: hypothetical protein ENH55_23205 [Aurantimonas coralicida]|uniref:Uncharacterized protein n=2 Tax=root TaxID=1 RepID=A0A9C9NI94_9HYPH|nr:hypothetical protein [Aurantimonas coralicida]HEU02287.1 hypothetical protein [Aurantimonas coralicida]